MKKTYSELIEYYENVSPREIIADMYFDYKEEIDKLVDANEDINREFSQYKYESKKEIERLNNKLKYIKSQLDYLETYSSIEDVFEDMKRRLDRIDKIIGSESNE